MQVYEIVVDGELSADLADALGPIPRRDVGGATVLSLPTADPDALPRVLALLETLGHRRDRGAPGRRPDAGSRPRELSNAVRQVTVNSSSRSDAAGPAPGRVSGCQWRVAKEADMSVNVDVGPIDYLALEFPGARLTGEGLAELVRLVDAGIIRVLDMRGLVRDADGTVTAVAITDLDGDGTLDLAVFEGVESDLLDEEDLAAAADLVKPGDAVAVLVYENTWAGPFVSAMRRAGAEVVASVRLPADAVIARLEALEAAAGDAE